LSNAASRRRRSGKIGVRDDQIGGIFVALWGAPGSLRRRHLARKVPFYGFRCREDLRKPADIRLSIGWRSKFRQTFEIQTKTSIGLA
jgi:hypothetical protein